MEAGAEGADNKVLVNFRLFLKLLPQVDVYKTRALSPVAADALLVNFILTIREVSDPESITALVPNVPTKDHIYPVAATAVVVAVGNVGAVYR